MTRGFVFYQIILLQKKLLKNHTRTLFYINDGIRVQFVIFVR